MKRNKKAGSASPEAVKKRTSKTTSGRPRPKSVYAAPITPMDTTETHHQNYNLENSPSTEVNSSSSKNNFRENDFTKKLSSSKLPVSSSSSNPRRLSLSPVKPKSVNMVDTSPMTAPVMSQMR